MSRLKLNKKIIEFHEIYELIALTEITHKVFINYPDHWDLPMNKLKFVCLKYKLYDIEELEEISNLNEEHLLNFCKKLKQLNKQNLKETIIDN